MESLYIDGSEVSPKVSFDPFSRTLELGGYSRPENAKTFYTPLVQWINDFNEWILNAAKSGGTIEPVVFNFKFIYFNSSSAKFIYDIVAVLGSMNKNKIPINIFWYYDADDDELLESGEELSEMSNIPFNYVPVNNN